MKDSFIFHLENEEDLQDLTPEETGQIFLAMIHFQKTGEEPEFDDRALRTAWRPILRRLKADEAAYQERCEKNRKNGQLGGRPSKDETETKNQTVFSETQKNQTVFSVFEKKPKKPDSDSDTDSDTDLYKDDDVTLHSINNIQGDESDDDGGAAKADIYLQLRDSSLLCIRENRIRELQKLYPEVNVRQQLGIIADKMRNSPSKRIIQSKVDGYIRTWLQKESDRQKDREANAKAKAAALEKKPGKKNGFHNFNQHDYDFDAIERALDTT